MRAASASINRFQQRRCEVFGLRSHQPAVHQKTETAESNIGAYPYRSGGFALSATYTSASGTATITPNDASLVRFVACYDDGVPTGVDSVSPYTCTVGSGTFSARAYPIFASATLYAQVALSTAYPAAPTNVRIR